MRLNAPQLAGALEKTLAPLYLVTGDEPLLVQEACDQIRAKARQQGFEERKVYQADNQLDWMSVAEEASALSLFSERKRLEITLPTGKIGNGKNFIERFLGNASGDVIALLISPRLDGAELRKKWVKTVQDKAVHVQVWPIEASQFPGWLAHRARERGLQFSEAAQALLADRVEGNLLAANQELDRLSLLAENGKVDEALIDSSVLDSSRFTVFAFAEALLKGEVSHGHKMLSVLEQEGYNALAVLAIVTRDLKQLIALNQARTQGQQTAAYFKMHRINQRQQQQALSTASHRLTQAQSERLLKSCVLIDRAAKGCDNDSPWRLLRDLLVQAAQKMTSD